VNRAPLLLAGLTAATLFLALPLSFWMRQLIDGAAGAAAAAAAVPDPLRYDWWEEFAARASGLGQTFTPSIIGFAAVLENASGLLDNRPLTALVASLTVGWLLLVSFLSGGIIDRYARQRPTRAHGFFGACGEHFWRFLRLGLAVACVYLFLFGPVHAWLFDGLYARLTRDVTVERTAFIIRAALYLVFIALLAAPALLFDYARIRIVVEDRRSALGALAAAARFIARRAGSVGRLFLLNAAAWLALAGAYAALSPGAPRTDMHVWLVLGAGQAYIVGRHYLKLLVYASETSLVQGALAHAGYTAAPVLVWPDSPAVESITNVGPDGTRW
jgi:hypothetical protein